MKGTKRVYILIAAGALAAAFFYMAPSIIGNGAGERDGRSAATLGTTAGRPGYERVTLDPNLFHGRVRRAYEVAERQPALLAELHCYCGCDRDEGHRNLLDCYRDKHGSSCAICVGEALDASTMAGQGAPLDQIRDVMRARYAHGG